MSHSNDVVNMLLIHPLKAVYHIVTFI